MDYRLQAAEAQKFAELNEEKVGLLNRLAEIDAALTGQAVATTVATVAAPKQAPKPTAQVADAPKRRGRPPKNPNAVPQNKEKRIELPNLLETIIQTHGKPMKHEELVVAARNAGYKSEAKDFSNMVYQCLVKLVKKGTLGKDNEGKNAEYTFRATA